MDDEPTVDRVYERIEGHWLLLAYPMNPVIRIDVRLFERVFAKDGKLFFDVNETIGEIAISAGADVAAMLADAIAPHTRHAPLRTPEAYRDAQERLKRIQEAPTKTRNQDAVLYVGLNPVEVTERSIWVGHVPFDVNQIRQYAIAGQSVVVPLGHVQAAVLQLAIEANRRCDKDAASLRRRITDYEKINQK